MANIVNMKIQDQKLELVAVLLQQKGLQELLNTAARLLGNPMFITDRGNHAIAVSDTKYVDDIGWTMMNISAPDYGVGVRDACLEEIISSGALEATSHTDQAYIHQFSFSDFRYISHRIMIHDMLVGQVVMIECFNAYTEDEEDLFKFVSEVLSEEMRHLSNPRMQEVPYYGIIYDLIQSGHTISHSQLASRTAPLGLKIPADSRVVSIQPKQGEMEMQLFHLRSLFTQRFPDSLAIVHNGSIVLIIKGRQALESVCDTLRFETKRYHVYIGISAICYSPLQLYAAYSQAQAAIEVGSKFAPLEKIYCYSEWSTLHIVDSACKSCSPETFYSPKFRMLLAYDQANHTSFIMDLAAYLENGKSVKQTAEVLQIHKNTMYYRLSKIEEICDCSLKDYQTIFDLQMSLYFYKEWLALNS